MTTTPTLSAYPRCTIHRHTLLTSEGACPTCDTEAHQAAERSPESARELRRLQTLERARKTPRREVLNFSKRGGW